MASTINLKVRGIKKYTRRIASASPELKKNLKKELKVIGEAVRKDAAKDINVRRADEYGRRYGRGESLGRQSGKLVSSLKTRVRITMRSFTVTIFSSERKAAMYGAIWEYTRYPFLRKAVRKNQEKIVKSIKRALDKL